MNRETVMVTKKKLTVNYPWKITKNDNLILPEKFDKQSEPRKPAVIASWSSKTLEIDTQQENQPSLPESVKITTKAFRTMNRDRVRLARAKKKLEKLENQVDIEKQEKLVSEQQIAFDISKSDFKIHQQNSKEKGYRINALGKWTN